MVDGLPDCTVLGLTEQLTCGGFIGFAFTVYGAEQVADLNAIAPGLIETTLSEYYWKDEGRKADILSKQPIRRIGKPSEIAAVALLLASDRASYMTGQTVVVDGGFLIPAL